jgi:hypothetical protein
VKLPIESLLEPYQSRRQSEIELHRLRTPRDVQSDAAMCSSVHKAVQPSLSETACRVPAARFFADCDAKAEKAVRCAIICPHEH